MVRVFTLRFGSFFFRIRNFFVQPGTTKQVKRVKGLNVKIFLNFRHVIVCFSFISLSPFWKFLYVQDSKNLLEQIAIELRKSRKLFKCQRRRRDRILRPLRLLLASVGPIPTESSTRRRYSLPASREPRASTERTEFNDPLGAKASERQRGSSATLEAGG